MTDYVSTYARHKFDSGVVQISAEVLNGKPCLRLAIKRVDEKQQELVSIVSLIFPKKYIEAAHSVVERLVEADFERANTLLLNELNKITKQ